MSQAHLNEWKEFMKRVHSLDKSVKIGLVGKYFATGEFTLSDSYLSVIEAIKHGSLDERNLAEQYYKDVDVEKYREHSHAHEHEKK